MTRQRPFYTHPPTTAPIAHVFGSGLVGSLQVLNLSFNDIRSIEPLARLLTLKAAVLNNNEIRDASPLNGLPDLNTVVLSNNRIETLDLQRCPSMRKLNASKNKIRKCPAVAGCYHLKELRLNGNKIVTLPENLMSCAQLCTLEIGQNLLPVEGLQVIRHFR